jgi:hypothetical protein
MKRLTMQFLVLFSLLNLSAQDKNSTLFDQINSFLVSNVEAGKLPYATLKANSAELNGLIAAIGTHDLTNKNDNYKKAFYINAYNLAVIKQVVDNYPITSPFDVDGFFMKSKFKIAGEMLTLDQLEFQRLMNPYKDSRMHFALGCAAMSCPSLYDNAFRPELIEQQLDFRAQLIIDRPNYVSVNEKTKTVTLNKIFDWYGEQFSYNAGSLINFINKYRHYKVPQDCKIVFQEYDWALNEVK